MVVVVENPGLEDAASRRDERRGRWSWRGGRGGGYKSRGRVDAVVEPPDDPGENEIAGLDEGGGDEGERGGGEVDEDVADANGVFLMGR